MYSRLDPEKIISTVDTLRQRIAERFPKSGLSQVAVELHRISQETAVRSARIQRANIPLRAGVGVLVLGIVAFLTYILSRLDRFGEVHDLLTFAQFFEASLGAVVFIGAAILFLVTLEIRWKRERAIRAIHELRALAHIVDMHQLTKDPETVTKRGPPTPNSPKRTMTPFELSRYLNYCSELLSLISKIGVLYAQCLYDPIALDAVDQVEDLTNGLSRKIWQKIMILDTIIDQPGSRAGSNGKSDASPPTPALATTPEIPDPTT